MKSKKVGIHILGGTGFGAGELMRLLSLHPEAEVVSVVSHSAGGGSISKAHPHLKSFYDGVFEDAFTPSRSKGFEFEVIISALPHGQSGKVVDELHSKHPEFIIIDLSGDLRMQDEALHRESYPETPFALPVRRDASYGLTEIFRDEVRESNVISNPGCLATGAILALAPLSRLDCESECAVHAATGSSGAGKDPKPSTHHPVRHSNFFAYKPLEHQHLGEIRETLRRARAGVTDISFVPHSLPVSRGILCTVFATLKNALPLADVRAAFRSYYESSPFVRVLEDGAAELENIIGSNFCDLTVAQRGKTVVIHTAMDNLVKGMAGQAIQNMNVRCGLPEISGLWFPSVRPV